MFIEPDLEFEPWTPEDSCVPVDSYFAEEHFEAAPEPDDAS